MIDLPMCGYALDCSVGATLVVCERSELSSPPPVLCVCGCSLFVLLPSSELYFRASLCLGIFKEQVRSTYWAVGVAVEPFHEAAQVEVGAVHAAITKRSHFRILLPIQQHRIRSCAPQFLALAAAYRRESIKTHDALEFGLSFIDL